MTTQGNATVCTGVELGLLLNIIYANGATARWASASS